MFRAPVQSLGSVCCVRSLLFGCTTKRFYPAKRKRFYKNVSVTQSEGQFEVCLDQRKLKTPMGKVFTVPSEGLAVAVATEWDAQGTEINQHSMHLTALSNTVLDNPSNRNKEAIAKDLLEFLESDTLCCRMQEPEGLAVLQHQKWDPVIQWYEDRYNVKLNVASEVLADTMPQETYDTILRHLSSYSLWGITGIQYATESLKSLILTQATIDRRVTVQEGVALARLETEFQTSRWGSVEWAHDLDREQVQARVSAAILFVQLTSASSSIVTKKVVGKM
ncbi:ATP synthase mitochondrial F1 complex assembly factor 2-like [Ornithodoros turicata]|uniref:ATP synthase mitochondrial F1 complex assembly factor 2-like n=1 Tax=Ornithodoros turicata TaxID=34597 RepID=UPI003138FE7D